MAVKIGHARNDENGGIDGAAGDQTGKEILVQDWYNRTGGWGVYLEPLDAEMAFKAAMFVAEVCADPAYGYSQPDRKSAVKAILANGGEVSGAGGNFDCSSLVFFAYQQAGLDVEIGYTGNLESRFMATGKFRAHRDSEHLNSPNMAVRGGIYLTAGKHVCMVLENTAPAIPEDGSEEANDPTGEADFPAEETDYLVTVIGRTVRVREGGSTMYPKLFTAKRGDTFPLTGNADGGWYEIDTVFGTGYISNNQKYTKLTEA